MSNEKNNNGESRAVKFFDEKGFYIVLILCVLAVGIAGYVFLFSESAEPEELVYDDPYEPDMSVLPSASYDDNPNDEKKDIAVMDVPEEKEQETVAASSDSVTVAKKETTVKKESASSAKSDSEDKKVEEKKPETKPEEKTEEKKKEAPTFFVRPVQGEIMTEFSGDELVFNKTTLDWRTHNGTDFAATAGEKVLCIADGAVEDIYTDTYYGTSVLVDHGGELKSVYTGLIKNAAVYIGQELKAGEVIGAVDTDVLFESGLAPHVHIEVIQNGERIDPMSLIES